MNVTITDEMNSALRATADAWGRPVTYVVREALALLLDVPPYNDNNEGEGVG